MLLSLLSVELFRFVVCGVVVVFEAGVVAGVVDEVAWASLSSSSESYQKESYYQTDIHKTNMIIL